MIKLTEEQIIDGRNKAYLKAGHNAYFGNGFNAGVEFALKQLNIPDVSQQRELVCTLHSSCQYQSGFNECSYSRQCDYKKQTYC